MADCTPTRHQAVGVIYRLPRVRFEAAAGVIADHSVVLGIQPGSSIDQQLNDRCSALVCCPVQRRPARLGLNVWVDAEVEEQLDRLQVRSLRPLGRDAFHPTNTGSDLQRRHVQFSRNSWIGTVREEQLSSGRDRLTATRGETPWRRSRRAIDW